MFVFKNGHRGAILNVRQHSIRECEEFKEDFQIMNVIDEMEWYCCGLILLHYLQDRVIMIGKSFKILQPR